MKIVTPKRLLVLPAILLSTLLHADTVHLTNGSSIDGTVVSQHDGVVVVEIGTIGRIEIRQEDVLAVEKNTRTGAQGGSRPPKRDAGEKKTPAPTPGAKKPRVKRASDPSAKPQEPLLTPAEEAKVRQWAQDLTRQRVTYRSRAERRLAEVGVAAVPFLLPLVGHPFDLTQISALRVLKRTPDIRVAPVALAVLADGNRFVRKLAWENLQAVSGLKISYPWDDTASDRQRLRAAAPWHRWWQREKARLEAQKLEGGDGETVGASPSPAAD